MRSCARQACPVSLIRHFNTSVRHALAEADKPLIGRVLSASSRHVERCWSADLAYGSAN